MGTLVSSAAALLLTSLLALLFGVSSILGQDLTERDALCNADGCFVVYFQRKSFLDSWKACKDKGGNLATIKRRQDENTISTLFSSLDLRHSRTKVQVWIGLLRQPRQCTSRPLRGFSWTTGDQDTEYTNWQKEDSPVCLASRCVVIGYNIQEQSDNFKWLDGSCSVPVDGYLCHYDYKGMCPALWGEGAGKALYDTPFDLLSTLLSHVPFGSVADMPCPTGTKEQVLCTQREDGSVGWSRDSPLCSNPPPSNNWCDQDNGGCEHFCRQAGAHSYCECADGYQLGDDGQSCELPDVCQGAPCQFECLPLSDGYRCACPEGYMLAPDERGCVDVDECLQSPCEQQCVNAPGTFECRCREGYHPDDEGGCEDIDECMNDPCEHECENTAGSHICHCHLGFSLLPEDPSRCQDTDECQIPGTCEQMCVNYEGGFECYCEEGYALLNDHSSCQKIGEGDDQSAATPPFPWVTDRPVWDRADYWNQQQSHTDWPPEVEQSLDWLTDPPRVLDSGVIWVTSAPQDDLPFESTLDPLTDKDKEDEERIDDGVLDWSRWEQGSQSELEVWPSTISTTPPPSTSSSTTADWYEDEEEETTTAFPLLPTSTISEGAWNWWAGLTTASQKPGNPDDAVTDHYMPTQSSYHIEAEEEKYPLRENAQFPEELEEEEKDNVETTVFQDPAVSTQLTPSQPAPSEGDIIDPVQEDRGQKQSSTWLLVGLLVPICIFIVVMVALGIVYCSRCAVQPRNKNATDCYHWISGAHDKQAAPNPSAGVKTHV
ncbi:CD248 molecule, endosialin a [Scomber scombrus]|uniref:CD248 molecule, endosialin a n=1 Tax=Scomber scombrus TaxID=13677 RepID=UPI002DDB8283|nr:CD248 molecule, endosialin a [Scomber scombrus]